MIFSAVQILVLILSTHAFNIDTEDDLAMENPDLFEGDIVGLDPSDRNVITREEYRWPNGVIPYVIDTALKKDEKLIKKSLDDYHQKTCLKFIPRTNERHYIKFYEGKGCHSYVGMRQDGPNPISLGRGCLHKGTIVHEVGHSIGFYHEHSRSDRDKHLIIYWDNIKQSQRGQFFLLEPDQNLLLTPFDYDSVMLYGSYTFSKDKTNLKTMVGINGEELERASRKPGLSLRDVERIRKMYNC